MICPKCNKGEMVKGKALKNTIVYSEDLGHEIGTSNFGGSGELVGCLKCNECGHSIGRKVEG